MRAATILALGATGVDWLAAHGSAGKVVAGIRPEDLRPVADAVAAPASLQAQLEVVEPVGNEVFLNLTCRRADRGAHAAGRSCRSRAAC